MMFPLQEDLKLPPTADFHVHLRDGPTMETVVPAIRHGGVDTVYVMPNLTPPIITVTQAMEYQARLQALEPNVTFLMTLFLHPSMTVQTIRDAKAAGIIGIKSYPSGVTTNSDDGVMDYAIFYPIFAEMERHDLVLNLHGEIPSTDVLEAEEAFLPTLSDLHRRFPRLRIVLEHCSTAAAIEAVRGCNDTVAATITAHHLFLTTDDWQDGRDPFNYCKPVAKRASDRAALLKAVVSGDPRFFFGSDSAPHPMSAKVGEGGEAKKQPAAGIFTQPYATQLVVDALRHGVEMGVLREEQVSVDVLQRFLSRFGREFYRLKKQGESEKECIVIRSDEKMTITRDWNSNNSSSSNTNKESKEQKDADNKKVIIPFREGQKTSLLRWVRVISHP